VSWQLGLMMIFGLFVVVWAIAEIVTEDRSDWIRLRNIEAGRLAQRADWIERSSWRGPAS
jgi:CelD/BcsL family acetyltransferase involved in cellulose biosynthesis